MKLFKANSRELFDENGKLLGEWMFGSLFGKRQHLKLNGKIYNIQIKGLFVGETLYHDEGGKLLLKIDSVHQRVFFYGEKCTEIYHYKSRGFFRHSISLYKFENDDLVMKFRSKQGFFKNGYEVEVENNCKNSLLILAFVFYNIRAYEN